MSIIKYNEIDMKKINYHNPEKQGGYYYSSISYQNKPLYIQTSKMSCRNTLSECLSKTTTHLDTETMNHDFSFYDFLLNLDEKNIKETFRNNQTWFQKEIPLDLIDDMYKRLSKGVKKDSKPTFSFKVPVMKDKPQCSIFDHNKYCIDHQKIVPQTDVILILHIRGLKFLKSTYYCDCYISQIKAFVSKEKQYSVFDQCMINDEEDLFDDQSIIDDEFVKELEEKEKSLENEKALNKSRVQKEIELKENEIENLRAELNNI